MGRSYPFAVCFWRYGCAVGRTGSFHRRCGVGGSQRRELGEWPARLGRLAGHFPGWISHRSRDHLRASRVVLNEISNWRRGLDHGGCFGTSMAWPGSQEPTRRICCRHRGQRGPHRSGSGSSGAGSSFDAIGGCHAACSAGVSTGGFPSRARTRLARTLAAGCNQPKVRTRAKPRGKTCCKKRLIQTSGSSVIAAGWPVLLSR